MNDSNYAVVKKLLVELSGQKGTITIPRIFLLILEGDFTAALVLNQFLFWSDKGKGGWFYKTYADWEEETALSEYQIRRCSRLFKKKGVLETKLKKANGAPTVHYKFNTESFLDKLQNGTFSDFRMETQVIQETMDTKVTPDSINSKEHKKELIKETREKSWKEFRESWKELFPKKSQPREDNQKLKDKLNTRITEQLFLDHWAEALALASESPTCQKESWFNAEFFLRNSENYMKCYERWMSWKDDQQHGQSPEGGNNKRNFTQERLKQQEQPT